MERRLTPGASGTLAASSAACSPASGYSRAITAMRSTARSYSEDLPAPDLRWIGARPGGCFGGLRRDARGIGMVTGLSVEMVSGSP